MAHEWFRPMLEEKSFEIIGEFSCLGFDTALTKEGINKSRPNKQNTVINKLIDNTEFN